MIKPRGRLSESLAGMGSSTILGDGEVALIVDVLALVDRAINTRAHETVAPH